MKLNRRGIIKAGCGLTLATGIGMIHPGNAITPIQRAKGTQLKLSLAAYSFRKELTAQPPEMTLLEGYLEFAAQQGLDAIEPTSYYFPEPVTVEYLLELKRRAFLNGLAISGTAIRNTYTYPAGPDRDREILHTKTWIDFAAILGAPAIRVFAGKAQDGDSLSQAQQYTIETLEEVCAYAGTKGVFLALENHGGIVDTAENMLPIVQGVQSPWFGVNLDTGNFTSEDPYRDIAVMAPYAVNVQIKVELNPGGKGKVPADLSRLVTVIRDSGYQGYIALEYEADEPALVAVPKYLKQLRELL